MTRTQFFFVFLIVLAIVAIVVSSLWGAGIIDNNSQKSSLSNDQKNSVDISLENNLRVVGDLPLILRTLQATTKGVVVRICDVKTVAISEVSVLNQQLCDATWTGLLITPLKEHNTTSCMAIYNGVIGPEEGQIMNDLSTPISQRLLYNVLQEYNIKTGFDLLIMDNTGQEWDALRNFDIMYYKPTYVLLPLIVVQNTPEIKTYMSEAHYHTTQYEQNYVLFGDVESTPLASIPRNTMKSTKSADSRSTADLIPNRDSWYNNYVKVCQNAVQNDIVFNTFKQNADYNVILEHLTQVNGAQYINEIERLYPEHNIEVDWEKIITNDTYGNPTVYKYKVPMKNGVNSSITSKSIIISPTSLRYVCLGMKILRHIKSCGIKNVDFVEIGGGYGGQCYVFHQLAEKYDITVRSYTIFDLPEASALQQKYLTKILLNSELYHIKFASPWQKDIELSQNSFLFSSYALGEISVENQELYYKILSSYISHGYIIWNSNQNPTENFYKLSSGKENVQTSEERPKTFHWNKVLTF